MQKEFWELQRQQFSVRRTFVFRGGVQPLIAKAASYSEEIQYGDYLSYKKVDEDDDGTYDYVEIFSCDRTVTEVEIPSEIDGMAVTNIDGSAFENCTSLESIEIPDSVTSIGSGAFSGCTSLENIIIPDSVMDLGAVGGGAVFAFCTSLKNVKLSNHLTELNMNLKNGDGHFIGCTSLTSINIPESIEYIYEGSFVGCENLTRINVSEKNNVYSSVDGIVFNKDKTELVMYPPGIKDSEYIIPDGIKSIYKYAFNYLICHNEFLTSITLPESIVEIDDFTFYSNRYSNVEKIKILNSDCVIYDSEYTIDQAITIYGYENSTAQAYAEKYDREFVALDDEPVTTTPVVTTTVTTTKVTTTTTKATTTTAKTTTKATTVATTITVIQKDKFVWGEDNWNFNNSSTYFKHAAYYIKDSYLNELRENLTNTEWYHANMWRNEIWGGSCYGMSSLALLSKEGFLPYNKYTSGADNLNEVQTPAENSDVESLINYYQLLQVKSDIQQQYRTVPTYSHEENIKNIISQLDTASEVVIGFQKNGWGGHAIVGYDVTYGSWTFNGVTYQGRIEILDPNYSMDYNSNACIYFNTKSYNWIIPAYSNVNVGSVNGAVFNMILSDADILNDGGYLSDKGRTAIENYIASLEMAAVSSTHEVTKVSRNINGVFMNQSVGQDEILPASFYVASGESEGTEGYILKDAESGYRINQSNAEKMDMAMKYENCLLEAQVAAGTEIIFDPSGFVGITGEATNYEFNMVYNEDYYPTDWYNITISGENAYDVNLEQVDNGYVMTADNLSNVCIAASNDDVTAEYDFTTEYDEVFIFEIDEKTIGVAVDTDDNGSYETVIDHDNGNIAGDANLDGTVSVADIVIVQKYLTAGGVNLSYANVDMNNDGKLNVFDIIIVKRVVLNVL